MSKTVDPKKTYVGVVENNEDPKKIGRCQIRVMDVFDNLKLEDIPWSSPWKDLNGNQFNIPDKGKVVTVVFENGNTNNPEYISSDHYNVNLEQKLQQLGKDDYTSMKSLLYDHKTQIYVNDSEGLKMDHKFNNVNIKEKSINVNLKDNFGKVNLGSQNATQRAILGDNFTNWFDTFLNILMGAQGGSFLGNLAAPVVATPALMSHIQLYFQLKDPKLLSKNVYIVDNDSVTKQERSDKVTEGQKGDSWASTVDDNKLTTKEEVKFTPLDGASSTTFDKPPVDAEKPLAAVDLAPKKADSHPDVDVLLELLKMKNYKIYDKPYELNIVSVRNQCLAEGDKYSDEFVDKLYALYKDDKDNWQVKQYAFSTLPGVEFTISESWLKQSQMENKDLSYWSTKIGQKITMKEFLKGPIVNDDSTTLNKNVVLSDKNTTKSSDIIGEETNFKKLKDLGYDVTPGEIPPTDRKLYDYSSNSQYGSLFSSVGNTKSAANNSLNNQINKIISLGYNMGTSQGSGLLGNLTSQGSGLLGNLTSQGSGILSNLNSQGSGILSNLTSNVSGQKNGMIFWKILNNGSYEVKWIGFVDKLTSDKSQNVSNGGLLGNLTSQGSGLLGNLTSQGSGILSNLTSSGSLGNLTSQGGLLDNLTNSLSSSIPMGDIKNLLSQGLDVDKVTNNLLKAKSLGIDLTKLDNINNLTQDELSKLSSSNINIVKLKSDLNLISSNTTLNVMDILKSLK